MWRNHLAKAWFVLFSFGCGDDAMPTPTSDAGDDDAGAPDAGRSGIALLGNGAHTPDAVDVSVLATSDHGLYLPRDLAFHPDAPDQLWIVNFGDSSVVILSGVGSGDMRFVKHRGPGSSHFLARPSAIAFGAPGSLATAQETDEITQPSTPVDFMGPTLWTSDTSIFEAGHASHYDMLHNSPNAVGIAWEADNVYWVVDGMHGSLTRYDFGLDHGLGGEDHTDGDVRRYVEGEIGYTPAVSSHAELDRAASRLYVADAANNRIAVLDTAAGTPAGALTPNYDGDVQRLMTGATTTTLVDGAAAGLVRPSGLALHEGMLFVVDNATSRIVAFDLEGAELDHLDLSPLVASGLQGVTIGPDGALYVADADGDRIFRVAPL